MVKIGENLDCRFWGYEPAIFDDIRNGNEPHAKRREVIAVIERHRLMPIRHGFYEQRLAVFRAKRVEKKTGIAMSVFNHNKDNQRFAYGEDTA